MQILYKAASFTLNRNDLRSIYLTYVRSILQHSTVVWSSSLTEKRRDLERVQKSAVRVIMGAKFTSYKNGLKSLNIEKLTARREKLYLKFAKKFMKNEKLKNFSHLKK